MKNYEVYLYPDRTELIQGASHDKTEADSRTDSLSIKDAEGVEIAWFRLDQIQGFRILPVA